MKKLEEMGICPNCSCSISIFKTNNYKRFAKCEICGLSYPLPKKGKILNSALICPIKNLPLLIVDRNSQKAYFWVDNPCFSCIEVDKCKQLNELKNEFRELKVYGY
ncbi:MAG: hypothetical protein ACFFAO_18795 [Candidatus Hermodarchaeota archaeon]